MILNPEAFVRAEHQHRLELTPRRIVQSETQCNPCRTAAPKVRLLGALHDALAASRIRLT